MCRALRAAPGCVCGGGWLLRRLQCKVVIKSTGPEPDGWAANPGSPLTDSVTQGNLLNLSVPQFPSMWCFQELSEKNLLSVLKAATNSLLPLASPVLPEVVRKTSWRRQPLDEASRVDAPQKVHSFEGGDFRQKARRGCERGWRVVDWCPGPRGWTGSMFLRTGERACASAHTRVCAGACVRLSRARWGPGPWRIAGSGG